MASGQHAAIKCIPVYAPVYTARSLIESKDFGLLSDSDHPYVVFTGLIICLRTSQLQERVV